MVDVITCMHRSISTYCNNYMYLIHLTEAKSLASLGEKNTHSAYLWSNMSNGEKEKYVRQAQELKGGGSAGETDSKVASRVKEYMSNVVSLRW